jgi:hypothetical protein
VAQAAVEAHGPHGQTRLLRGIGAQVLDELEAATAEVEERRRVGFHRVAEACLEQEGLDASFDGVDLEAELVPQDALEHRGVLGLAQRRSPDRGDGLEADRGKLTLEAAQRLNAPGDRAGADSRVLEDVVPQVPGNLLLVLDLPGRLARGAHEVELDRRGAELQESGLRGRMYRLLLSGTFHARLEPRWVRHANLSASSLPSDLRTDPASPLAWCMARLLVGGIVGAICGLPLKIA